MQLFGGFWEAGSTVGFFGTTISTLCPGLYVSYNTVVPRNRRLYRCYSRVVGAISFAGVYGRYKVLGGRYLYDGQIFRFSTYTTPFCGSNITGATVCHLGFKRGSFVSGFFTREVTVAIGKYCDSIGFSMVAFIPAALEGGLGHKFGRSRLLTERVSGVLNVGLCDGLLVYGNNTGVRRGLGASSHFGGMGKEFLTGHRCTLGNGAILLISSVGAANTALSRYTGRLLLLNTSRICYVANLVAGGGGRGRNGW